MTKRKMDQRKCAIDHMIRQATMEAVAMAGLNNSEDANVLRKHLYNIAEGVGHRITDDIGRMRRLIQLASGK